MRFSLLAFILALTLGPIVGLVSSPSVFAATEASIPPPADADMAAVIAHLRDRNPKPIETLTAAEARKQPTIADAAKDEMKARKIKLDKSGFAKIDDIRIEGAASPIPVRVYRPVGKAPLPLIVYFHGGGWVLASNDTYDSSARALAKQTGAIVLAVEYRKGPENKFPAAHEDAYAAYRWAVKNADQIGADSKKVAVAGESAGGNLALNVAIRARDEKFQMPVHELLIYPVASQDMNSASYVENANAKPLNKPMITWMLKNYLNTMDDAKDPRINLVAADLKGLPRTTVITAQIDPLNSDGRMLVNKLRAQGVNVNFKNFDGVTHEFFGMGDVVKDAKDAELFASSELRESFAR